MKDIKNKKGILNKINIAISFLILMVYMFLLIKNSDALMAKYNIELFYKGILFAIVLIFFSFLKTIRNFIYMDIIFDVYLFIFIVCSFLAKYLGKGREIEILFLNYPLWLSFGLIFLFVINVMFTFMKDKEK